MSVFNTKQSTSSSSIIERINVVDSNGNSLSNNFYSKNGGSINGNIILSGDTSKIIFDNGSQQSIAFDNGKNNQLENLIELTNNMTNSGTLLTINQDVEFLGNIEIQDNSISMSNINGLNNSIAIINTMLSNNISSISTLRTDTDSLLNQNLQSQISTNTNSISNLNNNISNLTTSLTNNTASINSQTLSIQNINDDILDINTNISNINTNLNEITIKRHF